MGAAAWAPLMAAEAPASLIWVTIDHETIVLVMLKIMMMNDDEYYRINKYMNNDESWFMDDSWSMIIESWSVPLVLKHA